MQTPSNDPDAPLKTALGSTIANDDPSADAGGCIAMKGPGTLATRNEPKQDSFTMEVRLKERQSSVVNNLQWPCKFLVRLVCS